MKWVTIVEGGNVHGEGGREGTIMKWVTIVEGGNNRELL